MLLFDDMSKLVFSGGSIVPNKIPNIGITIEIENNENITDRKLNSVFKIIRLVYGNENFKIRNIFFIIQI